METPFCRKLASISRFITTSFSPKISTKYGPIMHLKIGELSTIVISSPHVAEEALKKNDLAFADRPLVLLSKIVLYNYVNLSSSPYGEHWREMRKLFIMELLSSKKVKSFYTIMEEEVVRIFN